MECEPRRYAFPSRLRLKQHSDIARLFESGHVFFAYPVKALVLYDTDDDSPSPRVLFSVPKRLHRHAVQRNLIRRRLKEAFRLALPHFFSQLPHPCVIAFIYQTRSVLPFAPLNQAVVSLLESVSHSHMPPDTK